MVLLVSIQSLPEIWMTTCIDIWLELSDQNVLSVTVNQLICMCVAQNISCCRVHSHFESLSVIEMQMHDFQSSLL